MKKLFNYFFLLSFSLSILYGCTAVMTTYPKPSPGFEPKITYDIPQDALWGKVVNLLTIERIGVAKNEKSSNYIESEYVSAGNESSYTQDVDKSIRYKYTFMFEKISDNITKLNVLCKLESKAEVGGRTIDWHDITTENMELVKRIEKAMYEKVEGTLQKK